MKRLLTHLLILSIITTISAGNTFAQKKKKARVKIAYFKDFDKSERLEAILKAQVKAYVPVVDASILFYSVGDSSRVLLGEFLTNEDGKAIYTITEESQLFPDSSGKLTFEAEYAGNDTLTSSTKSTKVFKGDLEVSFFQKDSVKTIEVIATKTTADGEKIPIEGIDVRFNVKGTFSLLEFGKEETDESGKVQMDFPIDMPGDTAGVLTIVAKIDDDKKFGTIESYGIINWATPIEPVREKQRGLGDTDAPLWMVYTLIILLSAVWLHYMYVIFLIYKIKMAK